MDELQTEPVKDYDSLVRAFIAAKNHHNLTDEVVEFAAGMCRGHLSKVLTAKREKKIGWFTFGLLCEALAIEFVPRINLKAAARMASRWSGRNRAQIRIRPLYLTQGVIEAARSTIFSEFARAGGIATANRAPKERSLSVRKGWRTRRRQARRNGHASALK